MRVLFTTPVLKYPTEGGPALRIDSSIKALHEIVELHVISRVNRKNMGGIKAEDYYTRHCHHFEYSPSAKWYYFNKIFTFRFKSHVSFINYLLNILLEVLSKILWSRRGIITDANYLAKYAINNGIDIIWFGYGNISFELMKEVKERLPEMKMVCDTDSVWSRFILREIDTINDATRKAEIIKKVRRKEQEEKEWSKFMDMTTAVSEVDAEYYRSVAANVHRVKLFSNGLDLNNYMLIPEPPLKYKKPCMYLAGTFWNGSPMEQAARWIIHDVLPLVIKKIPEIHFYIIGNRSAEILDDIHEPNITITGKLDSVLPYLCNADVALVPLKYESGTRFKILEAGACGIPIVSTTLGAEGIPVTNGYDILIADESEIFAESIIRVVLDKKLSDKLSTNCKLLINKYYSINSLIGEANEIVNYLISNKSTT